MEERDLAKAHSQFFYFPPNTTENMIYFLDACTWLTLSQFLTSHPPTGHQRIFDHMHDRFQSKGQ
eukprot:11685318-Ditylum_brightwellii.AAC.1